MAIRVRRLCDEPLSKPVTDEALELLSAFFGRAGGIGSQMAVRAARGLADPEEIAASCVALADEILQALRA